MTTAQAASPTRPAYVPEPKAGLFGQLRLRVFAIDDSEAEFEKHGFTAVDDAAREQLEEVGRWFARGFRAAMAETDAEKLGPHLRKVEPEFRGFAFEGAAVAFTVLDTLVPTASRLRNLLHGPGVPHAWLIPVGYGWARTQLKRMPKRPPGLFDPLSAWLAIDGAGFHDGFYNSEKYLDEATPKGGLNAAAAPVYDQGLGRALWFYRGGDPERIATTIAGFPRSRRGDLWGGMASAATYAGGVGEDVLAALRDRAGEHEPDVAVGCVLAAKTRLLGGDVVPHTEVACSTLYGGSVAEAGRLVDAGQEGLSMEGHGSAYDALRARLRRQVAAG
ncbi:MAG: enediyne biosynthesis protein [Thermoleophilaceae bacterium]|nr:enediyne biosynthesis protein [Thermoleophilaceae bacterium]